MIFVIHSQPDPWWSQSWNIHQVGAFIAERVSTTPVQRYAADRPESFYIQIISVLHIGSVRLFTFGKLLKCDIIS